MRLTTVLIAAVSAVVIGGTAVILCPLGDLVASAAPAQQFAAADVLDDPWEIPADGRRWGGYGPAGLHVGIDADARRLTLHWGALPVDSWPVAVGRPQTPTPLGAWMIVDRGAWGGAFGARWMGLSVPWGRYGVHGTNRPGSIGGTLSAGCIRMFDRDVITLYRYASTGTVVVVSGSPGEKYGEVARSVRFAMRGSDVMGLQQLLWAEGLYSGGIDGIFGYATLQALRSYHDGEEPRSADSVDPERAAEWKLFEWWAPDPRSWTD